MSSIHPSYWEVIAVEEWIGKSTLPRNPLVVVELSRYRYFKVSPSCACLSPVDLSPIIFASVLSTGSGKTYTMWGPPSAMLEDHSPSSNHGIVPPIFQMLFSEFQRLHNELLCYLLVTGIYEQIGDLLDPTRRNLQIEMMQKNLLFEI
ncbi:hypothetical protein GIB67_037354 [Kingdonia uniflora]|uniref:Kinesin motor domain-containing protein n=1 Tax=Kingdonia uniflora TaxID=39325 RepID=A0A7J7NV35_9MAGN|nr:hypothetical protein GIB67_037354 [Kingdonia uniflora]